MKITCPTCNSENLDQGLNGKILCHDCQRFWLMVGTWQAVEDKC